MAREQLTVDAMTMCRMAAALINRAFLAAYFATKHLTSTLISV
jgi:hypothetical protein